MDGNDMKVDTSSLPAEHEVIVSWIESNWNVLATFAWRNYVTSGRGLVILDGNWDDDVAVGYQTPATATNAGHAWADDLLNAIRRYEPATDIVFLIAQGNTAILLGMTAMGGRQRPHLAGVEDNEPPLVSSA